MKNVSKKLCKRCKKRKNTNQGNFLKILFMHVIVLFRCPLNPFLNFDFTNFSTFHLYLLSAETYMCKRKNLILIFRTLFSIRLYKILMQCNSMNHINISISNSFVRPFCPLFFFSFFFFLPLTSHSLPPLLFTFSLFFPFFPFFLL